MRCGCLLLALTVFCFVIGFVGLHESLAYSSPTTITYEQFVKQHPTEGWFIIKGCRIDLTDAIYELTHYESKSKRSSDSSLDSRESDDEYEDGGTDGGKPKSDPLPWPPKPEKAKSPGAASPGKAKSTAAASPAADTPQDAPVRRNEWLSNIWLPVHGANSPEGEKVSLVLATMDPKLRQIVEDIVDMDKRDASEAEVKKWTNVHLGEMVVERDLRGMLQSGLLADEKTKSKIAALDSTLNPDYLILDDGRKPAGIGPSIGMLFLGTVLGLVTLLAWFGEALRVSRWFRWAFGRGRTEPPYVPGQYENVRPTIYAPYSSQPPYASQPAAPPIPNDEARGQKDDFIV